MDRRVLIVLGLIVLVVGGVASMWSFQGVRMRTQFIEALRGGEVQIGLAELRDKAWTDEELATVEVITLPGSHGEPQAISRLLYLRGRDVISRQGYAYQATIEDHTTGIVHVFGASRRHPGKWGWVSIHPDSQDRHIERRLQEVESLGGPGSD